MAYWRYRYSNCEVILSVDLLELLRGVKGYPNNRSTQWTVTKNIIRQRWTPIGAQNQWCIVYLRHSLTLSTSFLSAFFSTFFVSVILMKFNKCIYCDGTTHSLVLYFKNESNACNKILKISDYNVSRCIKRTCSSKKQVQKRYTIEWKWNLRESTIIILTTINFIEHKLDRLYKTLWMIYFFLYVFEKCTLFNEWWHLLSTKVLILLSIGFNNEHVYYQPILPRFLKRK